MTTSGTVRVTRTVTPRPVSYAALWFGFLGASVAWTVQELAATAAMAHSCFPVDHPVAAAGVAWPATLVVTVVTLFTALAALWVSIANWRATRGELLSVRDETGPRSNRGRAFRYLSFAGIPFGVIFAALIVFNGIALFTVPVCGGG